MPFRVVKHKFRAQPVKSDGHHFPSKLEFACYEWLKTLVGKGVVLFFLRQVPFHLPGGVKYVADFMVFYADGTARIFDVKGIETSEFITKKKIVETMYPVTIEVIKKGNMRDLELMSFTGK